MRPKSKLEGCGRRLRPSPTTIRRVLTIIFIGAAAQPVDHASIRRPIIPGAQDAVSEAAVKEDRFLGRAAINSSIPENLLVCSGPKCAPIVGFRILQVHLGPAIGRLTDGRPDFADGVEKVPKNRKRAHSVRFEIERRSSNKNNAENNSVYGRNDDFRLF
jgi:hypothetical protein